MASEDTPRKIRLLIVDDDRKLCRLLDGYLSPFGYDVTAVHSGPEGLDQASTGSFQAVVLDVMLPGMDGFEVLKNLRKTTDVPVLMLTARGDETDRVVGLEIGADDYLPKTFSPRELLARLRAVTRRSFARVATEDPALAPPIVVGEVRVEPASRTATVRDESLDLTPFEFDLLTCLTRGAGRVQSRDQIMEYVAGRDTSVLERSIDVHVSSLRRKLGDDPHRPRFIKTVRAVGYMFLTDPANAG